MEANNLGVPILLRNHDVAATLTPDVTIMDAILSSCASPDMLTTVHVEESLWEHSYVSADFGLVNPTRQVIKAAYEAFGEAEYVACLLSLGSGHRGVIRAPALAYATTRVEDSAANESALNAAARKIMEDPERVSREMDEEIGSTGLYFRFSVDQGMQISKRAAERRESMKTFGFSEGSLELIMTDTVSYLGQPRIVRDMDHCIGAMVKKVGIETLGELCKILPLTSFPELIISQIGPAAPMQ